VKNFPYVTAIAFLLFATTLQADERLKGIACRSVHLAYPAPDGTSFYNECKVTESAEGTYFMVCGFHMGYFGTQELANGKKVVLFSVWDPGSQNDPNATPDEKKVKVLFNGDDVRVKRFGGEGTGGQSFFDFDWQKDETYRFLVRSKRVGDRTAFAGYFYLPKEKKWKHLVTFSTLTKHKYLRGYYSFVEDFRRNRVSTTKTRTAEFSNGWVQDASGKWHPLKKSRFTADANPVLNINAGSREGRYFLSTGGDITNDDTPLWKHTELPESAFAEPTDLPDGDITK